MADVLQNPSGGVTYYTFTKEQLDYHAKEVAKNVLIELGVNFDEQKAKFTTDTSNELRPLTYWLAKMNVNRSTIWRWQQEGRITPTHIGKKVFFRQRDFDDMFAREKG